MGENEEEEVTPEQTDLIVQFSAATGTEDLDQCAANLRVRFGVGEKIGTGIFQEKKTIESAPFS